MPLIFDGGPSKIFQYQDHIYLKTEWMDGSLKPEHVGVLTGTTTAPTLLLARTTATGMAPTGTSLSTHPRRLKVPRNSIG